jgi:hypothetical protein
MGITNQRSKSPSAPNSPPEARPNLASGAITSAVVGSNDAVNCGKRILQARLKQAMEAVISSGLKSSLFVGFS